MEQATENNAPDQTDPVSAYLAEQKAAVGVAARVVVSAHFLLENGEVEVRTGVFPRDTPIGDAYRWASTTKMHMFTPLKPFRITVSEDDTAE